MGGRQGRQWLAGAVGLALLLRLLFTPSPAEALSWRLPGRGADAPARPANGLAGRTLREVPPPTWVQQARAALEERDPRVRILAPADGELLPDGPWTLRLQVSDWPLVEAGPLGLGPHLVVQLDGEPPRPIVDTEVRMPPLSPGSHLLTVYAAKPWGEAHKSPLALCQVRLHRLAANPATLPAPGSPQLIPVSPAGLANDPPLLLDWLLIDAPLQGLRGDASGWRLRLTVNGESVLVDQQLPLWLQGWKPGENALLLELLDGRGDPLNPPFNSLLREVIVSAGSASGSARALSAPRTDLEIAVLLGDQPVSALIPPEPAAPAPSAPPLPSPAATTAPTEGPAPTAARPDPRPGPDATAGAAEAPAASSVAPAPRVPPSPDVPTAPVANLDAEAPIAPEPAPSLPAGSGRITALGEPANTSATVHEPTAPAVEPTDPSPPDAPPHEAASAAASPPPTAAVEVNPDGTLKRPAEPSPFDRLRERLRR